jgi:hypothetical protein
MSGATRLHPCDNAAPRPSVRPLANDFICLFASSHDLKQASARGVGDSGYSNA